MNVYISYVAEEGPVRYGVQLDDIALAELIRQADSLEEQTSDRAEEDE